VSTISEFATQMFFLNQGLRAESNAPRANKRFPSSIIRSTDDHNKAVLQAQAYAAQEIKRERAELERKERRRLRMPGGERMVGIGATTIINESDEGGVGLHL
jgi:hypothetical protein